MAKSKTPVVVSDTFTAGCNRQTPPAVRTGQRVSPKSNIDGRRSEQKLWREIFSEDRWTKEEVERHAANWSARRITTEMAKLAQAVELRMEMRFAEEYPRMEVSEITADPGLECLSESSKLLTKALRYWDK